MDLRSAGRCRPSAVRVRRGCAQGVEAAIGRGVLHKGVQWCLQCGLDELLTADFDLRRRLSHHSPVMTAEVYAHLMRERYEEGRQRMEAYMACAEGTSQHPV